VQARATTGASPAEHKAIQRKGAKDAKEKPDKKTLRPLRLCVESLAF
jgi:hypothetical protein